MTEQPRQFDTNRWLLPAACFIVVLTLLVFRWKYAGRDNTLPVDSLQVSTSLTNEKQCIECHVQAEQFHATGHANALIRSTAPESRTLLRGLHDNARIVDEGTAVELQAAVPVSVNSSSTSSSEIPLDWCFGSGRHARTWVSTLGDSQGATDLLEFRWTWYRESDGFGITPGQPDQHFATHLGPFGVLYDHPKARRCFACHATYLPISDGQLQLDDMVPGVNCQRCHGPRAEHVASGGEVRDDFWQAATPLEAVDRCAQCHRRPEEVETEAIHSDDPELARFQPIGLVESKCFTESQKMTCTTCHDPHLPLDQQDSLGIWQCIQCHDSSNKDHTLCGAGEVDQCLQCHMPKVRSDAPLLFTDHWIRVR